MNNLRYSGGPWSARVVGPSDALPVLLLHSIATSSQMWTPQLAPWSGYFRLIVPDLPGHGDSPLEATATSLESYAAGAVRLLDHLQLSRVAVVGLSLGGMIGQALALHHPERLLGLVISNSFAAISAATAEIWERRKQQALMQGMVSQVESTLARWFTPRTAQDAPMTLRWVADMIGKTDAQGYAAAISAIQQLNYLPRLSQVRIPTLVVTGSDDALVTPEVATELAGQLPHSTRLTIAGAAHLANIEQPLAYTEGVGAFLRELARRFPVQPATA